MVENAQVLSAFLDRIKIYLLPVSGTETFCFLTLQAGSGTHQTDLPLLRRTRLLKPCSTTRASLRVRASVSFISEIKILLSTGG